MKEASEKGFTLIELLVVIAIVAILSVVVIVTLNPAELLKQSRDSNRISDLNTIKSAISLYMVDVATTTGIAPSFTTCYMSTTVTSSRCGSSFGTAYTTATSGSANIDGTGWVTINFNALSTKSPLSKLPVDPTNNGTYFYAYGATSTAGGLYKIVASMESSKYADMETNAKDGGSANTFYEVGTNLAL